MFFPLPGSFAIPTLGGSSVLLSLDAHAVAVAVAVVGTTLALTWVAQRLRRPARPEDWHLDHPGEIPVRPAA